jgi:DNA-binding transcriptional LysR family regulator
MLRFPGLREHFWTLTTPKGPAKFEVHGPFDSDDGDVLTGWALSGRGIINKPRFEVEPYLRSGEFRVVLPQNPPTPIQLAAIYPHKKLQDPKVRLLVDFMAERCQRLIREILAGK